jgi:hypothetical protein
VSRSAKGRSVYCASQCCSKAGHVDWDHRYDAHAPLYRQISRGGLVPHVSEHPGDGSPGARLRVMMHGVGVLHREISAKAYRYLRPGLEITP